jgi:eukaryotic-like serine/threonine-protein kinase
MSLRAGTRLGPYQIAGMLGAGGMGEVYRARDPRLGRDVAIKILPAAWVSDAARRERFEREARATAALNHSNVVAIHDVGTDDGIPFIVSELLEGSTLRDHLTPAAPWPVGKAVNVGGAIAHGLAAAHARGIVHRDLKPENVFITRDGVVKILDFGLARIAVTTAAVPGDPAITETEVGTVLGTVGYMSPEQVRGLPADHRTDIFACGAILFEMLSGRRAFAGGSAADTMTAILTKNPPPITDAEHAIPPALERIVSRCLEKPPEARFQSASDLAFALDALSGMASRSAPDRGDAGGRRWRLAVGTLAALIALGATYLALRYLSEAPPAPPLTRLQIATGTPVIDLTVSPDDRTIAYIGKSSGGTPSIWLRSLDRAEPHKVSGTEGASTVFWSYDSRFLAFISEGRLRKVPVDGGPLRDICAAPGDIGLGGSWSEDDAILFSTYPSHGIYRVSADGGEPSLVTKVDAPKEYAHVRPRFVDGTSRFLYSALRAGVGRDEICAASFDTSDRRCIARTSWFDYAPAGVLLFVRGGEIVAQRLEPESLKVQGTPVVLAGPLSHGDTFGAIFAASSSVLAVRPEEPGRVEQLTWYDPQGRALGTLGVPTAINTFDLSPDGRRVAIARGAFGGGGDVLLLIDTARGVTSPLTGREFDSVDDPVWSPDSRLVAFKAIRGLKSLLVVKPADGGPERVVIDGMFDDVFVEGWSPDGRFLAINFWDAQRPRGALLPLEGKPEPIVFVESANDESDFSPTAVGSPTARLQTRDRKCLSCRCRQRDSAGNCRRVAATSHGGGGTGRSSIIWRPTAR